MSNDDFFDFMVFWELMFPEDEDKTFKCPSCDTIIKGDDKVPWIDKKNKIFKCPDCGKLLQIEPATEELVEVEKKEVREKELQPQKVVIPSKESLNDTFICKFCGKEFKRKDVYEIHDSSAKAICYKCFDCENKFRLEEEERRRKLTEEISREVDASGICFPIGPLMSGEKFVCRVRGGKAVFYLDLITLDLMARCKNDIIKEMVGLFTASGIVKDGLEFYKRLLWREGIGSTAIGQGIALPYIYADLAIEEEIATALAIVKEGVTFDSYDGEPTRLIFMSANRPFEQTKPAAPHLYYLAMLSRFLKSKEHRQALLSVNTKEEAFLYLKTHLAPIGRDF
jgi:PTS system fructose-specific IIC component